jgi:tetratricopeptide (TPR) repeat protein
MRDVGAAGWPSGTTIMMDPPHVGRTPVVWRPRLRGDDNRRAHSGAPLHILLFVIFLLVSRFGWSEESASQHYQTGLAYERLGQYDQAYTELQLASALDPVNGTADVALGIVACRIGSLDVAQRALEHSIAVDANSVASYYQLALLYEKKNKSDRALDAWHRFYSLSQDETLKTLAQKHIQFLESHGQ